MESSSQTAREMFEEIRARPVRPRFGFGKRPLLVNVDLQKAYTDVHSFKTAYETDPRQIEHVNALARLCRERAVPVVWTYVAYSASGNDCGPWGTRSDTPDSIQNIKDGEPRAQLDPRCEVVASYDTVMLKRMPSAFFETNLSSLCTFLGIDTIIVTGGSTSGCVRATAVESLSRGFRTIVPIECVADKHEGPHFANLYDMATKYADVLPAQEIAAWLEGLEKKPAGNAASGRAA
ncbi:MAG: isochorismatase family protein [Mesorhizobium sp.]